MIQNEMKKDVRPKERLQFTIEFADNGIILRNPDILDVVKVALNSNNNSEIYRLIGEKIYDWLVTVVVPEYYGYWATIGAELDVTATLLGRNM